MAITPENYDLIKKTAAVIATIGLYSVLYKENKFYRFWEHIFLGLAAGWAIVLVWTDVLHDNWWVKMMGQAAQDGSQGQRGYWLYAALLPIGLMGYFVFSKKNNWISRIPIGIILGLYSGQQVQVWWNRYGPQMSTSIKPILPNDFSSFFVPDTAAPGSVYASTAISNFVFVFTLLSVLSYFLFSFSAENKVLQKLNTSGRWMLMIGFGAIFGSTVTMRFTLLIDRMHFIWIDWLTHRVLHL